MTTLDELAHDPQKAATLTPAERRTAILQCSAILAAVSAGPEAPLGNGAPATADADRAVGLKEAAQFLGMTEDSLYRKWRELGVGYRDVDRRVKFSLHALRRYIARRSGKPS